MDDNGLNVLRREIDEIDEKLLQYLARRFELSKEIGGQKRLTSRPVVQSDRAAEVLGKYLQAGQALGMAPDFLSTLYRLIHAESCRVQEICISEHACGHQPV